ncbi:hypothetical protein [Zooshikella harenae]|uniref:Uncharacterized protein n=1 Tax=Zooshikella harenae TaxID=2827238 RepID=A0ABS5ZGL0_9GAMM|nr:hypothetical protein [Zooshikella harenae]MBU2713197.1 hypothetical protein [Zooshikella harenae]
MEVVNILKFGELVSRLPIDGQITFYERFAHELTIVIRCVWSNEKIDDAEKVDRMKWLNEIIHRIPSKLSQLRNQNYEWENTQFEEMVLHWVKQNTAICKEVNNAIGYSYKAVKCIV